MSYRQDEKNSPKKSAKPPIASKRSGRDPTDSTYSRTRSVDEPRYFNPASSESGTRTDPSAGFRWDRISAGPGCAAFQRSRMNNTPDPSEFPIEAEGNHRGTRSCPRVRRVCWILDPIRVLRDGRLRALLRAVLLVLLYDIPLFPVVCGPITVIPGHRDRVGVRQWRRERTVVRFANWAKPSGASR